MVDPKSSKPLTMSKLIKLKKSKEICFFISLLLKGFAGVTDLLKLAISATVVNQLWELSFCKIMCVSDEQWATHSSRTSSPFHGLLAYPRYLPPALIMPCSSLNRRRASIKKCSTSPGTKLTDWIRLQILNKPPLHVGKVNRLWVNL